MAAFKDLDSPITLDMYLFKRLYYLDKRKDTNLLLINATIKIMTIKKTRCSSDHIKCTINHHKLQQHGH